MHIAIAVAAGLLAGAGATLYFGRKIVSAARQAETIAKFHVQRAREEYRKLKAGLAHNLDQLLK
jgi:hypothetical protein